MDGRLNYSVQEGWQNQDGGNTGTANASWQGGYGQATAGYVLMPEPVWTVFIRRQRVLITTQ